jgi:ABC-type Mn2+/Zn2+ transport system permease subunit
VVPPVVARLLTRSYRVQILLSAAVAVAMGAGGVLLAGVLPAALGQDWAVSGAGMVAVVGGVMVLAARLRARESR